MFVTLNLLITSVVATTNKNSNASLVYAFLYKLVEVSETSPGRSLTTGLILQARFRF